MNTQEYINTLREALMLCKRTFFAPDGKMYQGNDAAFIATEKALALPVPTVNVEAVARAMYVALPIIEVGRQLLWVELDARCRDAFMARAKAAIEACGLKGV